MRARRTSTVEGDDPSWSEGYEPAADVGFDEPPAPGRGPLRVCLACGEAPTGRECPHDEVASLDDASPAIRSAARQLAGLAQQRRSAERALRRLVDAERVAGRASIETAAPPPPAAAPAAPPAPTVVYVEVPAPRARRRAHAVEAQGAFAFAAPPPPPTSAEEAPKPAKKPRRKPAAVTGDDLGQAAGEFPAR